MYSTATSSISSVSSHLSLQSSFSYNSTYKWASSIESATVISYEKKREDQKIWYLIKVIPQHGRSYFIARRYEDFHLLSQNLHAQFSTAHGSQLPPLKPTRLHLFTKQWHAQRMRDLNQYLTSLFHNPSFITDARITLDFFGLLDRDLQYIDSKQQVQTKEPKWKRLRCTSFLASKPSSPPLPQPALPARTIKIKVIYDVNNIIVVQVARSITLQELRARIAQKFSDPRLHRTNHEMVLLFDSGCTMLPAILINKEQDLLQMMHTKWNRLDKVTLRCIM